MSIRIVAAIAACVSCTSVIADQASTDNGLDTIVVTASRIEQPISDVIGSVTVIDRAEIEQRQAQSLQDLLRGEAGIDIENQGGLGKASAIYLRGGNADQTLILVNGQRLGSATTGTTAIEFIPVDQIERIEIVRGPRSSLYGSDAIGGVIQIFTRQADGFNGSATYGYHDTQGYSTGYGFNNPLGLRFSVNGNYLQSNGFNSCSGNPITFAGCGTYEPDDDGYRNLSGSARIGYAFSKTNDLEFSTLYSHGFTEYDGSFENQTRFTESAPAVKWRVQPANDGTLTLSAGETQDKQSNFENGQYMSRFNTDKHLLSAQYDWQTAANQIVTLGGDHVNDVVDSDTQYDQTSRSNTGYFLQYLGKIDAYEVAAAIRRDDNQQFGEHDTGNIGWKWLAADRSLTFNVGWGTAFHAPNFNDLYYPGFSNPNLMPETSASYELGATGIAGWLSWSLQVYQTKVDNLIALNDQFLPFNIDEAQLRGAELSMNAHWSKWRADVNYTALDPRSRSADATYNNILPHRARQSGRFSLSYDFRYRAIRWRFQCSRTSL